MGRAPPRPLLLLLILVPTVTLSSTFPLESTALLRFRSSLTHTESLPWDPRTPPCTWTGVICFNDTTVWGLQLEHMGLSGTISVLALEPLSDHLRTLSFWHNNFSGPIPDFRRLLKLRSIYLSGNRFEGEIGDDWFLGMNRLRRLFLSNNTLEGRVPSSLVTLPRLVELRMEGNRFEGMLPGFEPLGKLYVNVAGNQLEGPIPACFAKLSADAFAGNKGLCGPPLGPCPDNSTTSDSPSTQTAPTNRSYRMQTVIIILSVFLGLAILNLIIVLLLLLIRRRTLKVGSGRTLSSNRQKKLASYDANQVVSAPSEDNHSETKKAEPGKLYFLKEGRETFDLLELLKASAEVLGSGNLGSTYKAMMLDGQAVVVKRFRQTNKVVRQDFYEQMRRMGRLRHQNVLPVIACYYRKEEKLMIYDYAVNGSLASHLHGSRNMSYPGLDWHTRLQIIKGVARGLAYLYNELPSLTLPHGHLKSSNVLLDASFEPLLTDYALAPLLNTDHAPQLLVAYKSPEYETQGQVSKKTDVWSVGVLILETLTGKFPANYLSVGNVKGSSLTSWINGIASELESNGGELFDKEMGWTESSQVEMRKLLEIGLRCCQDNVDTRWSVKEALENIEMVKERDESK
ncbi:hypothetical protein Drorol1_Dr00007657 [Drosera rotundifolia]